MTTTGAKRTKERFNDIASQYFVPYDLPFAVKRFLKQTHPKILIVMETELWPNMLKYTAQYKIPTLLANGRLSKKSLRSYFRIRLMANRMLNRLTKIAAQADADSKRYQTLGASKEQITITGNMKFDIKAPQEQIDTAKTWRDTQGSRPTWIAASTHEGEEKQIFAIHQQLQKEIPNLLLVLVPRHPQRFDEVYELCKQQGNTIRRSEGKSVEQNTTIFLGDTMGELFFYYAIADVAFMGGSFAPIGGHNFLECVAVNTPIIIGPHYHNFKAMVNMFNRGGGIQVCQDANDAKNILQTLLTDENKREQQASSATKIWAKNSGSVERHVALVDQLLSE